ncbi:MAG: DUF1566 domain-containing protein [Nitrospirae bacterium]|nr:DUF1566 domain-containing protein [Nitrospirota bacterium]
MKGFWGSLFFGGFEDTQLKTAMLAGVLFLFAASTAWAGVIDLPRTGQTFSYEDGDDGSIQAGVAWPEPRLTDNGDQTVTDNLTGLVWTKDTDTPTVTGSATCTGGAMNWQSALDYVACLNINNHLGHNDWRLPNLNEFRNLRDIPNYRGLPYGHPFTNVSGGYRWTSTTILPDSSSAWTYSVASGVIGGASKTAASRIWPVRGGQGGVIQIARTGAETSYAAGDDRDIQAGVQWPSPRFMAIGDGTVEDTLTGLMWTDDANLTGTRNTWVQARDYVAGMNAGTHANYGHTDWRLPNIVELESLITQESCFPVLPSDFPFINVQTVPGYYWYWTSSLRSLTGALALQLGCQGQVPVTLNRSGLSFFWPVRGGTVLEPGTDTTAPATLAGPSEGSFSSPISVTLLCSDGNGGGCAGTYYCFGSGCTPTTNYSGAITISDPTNPTILKYYSKDNAGNNEVVKTGTYYLVDILAPTGSISINSGAAVTSSVSVTLTLSSHDDFPDGGIVYCIQVLGHNCPYATGMKLSNDGFTWTTPEVMASTKPWTLTPGDGTKRVYVKFRDTSNNWSGAYSDTIILDTTAPVTTASPAGGTYSSAQSVTLTCNDGTGSSCAGTYYCLGASCTPTTVYNGPISIPATTYLRFYSKDNANNSEPVKMAFYNISTTLRTPTIYVPPTNTTRTGSLTVSWSGVNGSGVTYILEVSTNGGATYTSAYTGTALSKSFNGLTNGSYKYRVKATKPGFTSSAWGTSGTCVVALLLNTPSIYAPPTNSTGSYTVGFGASNVSGVTYVAEVSTNGGATFTNVYTGTASSKAFTGMTNGTYIYRVKATKQYYTDSAWRVSTPCVVALVLRTPSIYAPPSNSTGNYTVSWSSGGVAGVTFVVEKSTDGGATFTSFYTGTLTSVPVTNASNGSYVYRVKSTKPDYIDSAWRISTPCVVTRI